MELVLDTSHRPQRHQITPYSLEQKLGQAIRNNEGLKRVKCLVEEGADISCPCDNYWTPLTLAAHLGKADIVCYLLKRIQKVSNQAGPHYKWTTSVDSVNDGGETPLICAARQGHSEICCILLEAGADVNIRGHHSKQSALLVAVEAKKKEVVKVLLDWAADVQLTDNVGITPLYSAVEGNCPEIVHQLINAGCDVNIGSQDHAPLFLAARRGFLTIVQTLCEAGCYKDIANKYGVTSLYEAALKGQNTILQYLIDQGCDVNRYDLYKANPLQAAVLMGNTEGVKMLVRARACVKWRNSQGQCAIQMALEMGRHDILEFFLKSGVDISKRPNLTFIEPGRMSSLRISFERSVFPKTILVLLRGCTRLDLRMVNNISFFWSQPVMLELALAAGLAHPPSRLLTRDLSLFQPQCQRWLETFWTVPMTLKTLSRCCIRRSLGNIILHNAPKLPLPAMLVDYVMFAEAELEEV